jgi:hypothetical protein
VAEWSKAHAWKVCIRQKRIEGSNPFLSAIIYKRYTLKMGEKFLTKLKFFGLAVSVFALLFKLLSWQWAEVLLIVGLGTLGVYFFARMFK